MYSNKHVLKGKKISIKYVLKKALNRVSLTFPQIHHQMIQNQTSFPSFLRAAIWSGSPNHFIKLRSRNWRTFSILRLHMCCLNPRFSTRLWWHLAAIVQPEFGSSLIRSPIPMRNEPSSSVFHQERASCTENLSCGTDKLLLFSPLNIPSSLLSRFCPQKCCILPVDNCCFWMLPFFTTLSVWSTLSDLEFRNCRQKNIWRICSSNSSSWWNSIGKIQLLLMTRSLVKG